MKKIVLILVLAVILFGCPNPPEPPDPNSGEITLEEMKYCEQAEDCQPVRCSCTCSGCGGFSYEEVVNKKFAEKWYEKNNCTRTEVCPQGCCMPNKVFCENNSCVVKQKPEISGPETFTSEYCSKLENRIDCIEFCSNNQCSQELCNSLLFDAAECSECKPGCCSYCNDLDKCEETGCSIKWINNPLDESRQFGGCENKNQCETEKEYCSYLSDSFQGYGFHSTITENSDKALEYIEKSVVLQELYSIECIGETIPKEFYCEKNEDCTACSNSECSNKDFTENANCYGDRCGTYIKECNCVSNQCIAVTGNYFEDQGETKRC